MNTDHFSKKEPKARRPRKRRSLGFMWGMTRDMTTCGDSTIMDFGLARRDQHDANLAPETMKAFQATCSQFKIDTTTN